MSPAVIKDGIDIIRSQQRYEFFMKYGLAQLSYIASSRKDRGINIIIFISSIRCTTFCGRLTDHNNFILPLEQDHKMFQSRWKSWDGIHYSLLEHSTNKNNLCFTKRYRIVSNKNVKHTPSKVLTHLLIMNASCLFTLLMLYYSIIKFLYPLPLWRTAYNYDDMRPQSLNYF